MTDNEQEYEVESVLLARVAKKSARSKQLIWQYRVKWKGYSSEESTWEPKESFEGSEYILAQFWARANTNGRDIEDLSLFRVDENFYPTGPPRRPGKRKSTGATPSKSSPEVKTETEPLAELKPKSKRARSRSTKRKRSPSVDTVETEPQPKRARGRPSGSALPKSGENSAPLSCQPKDKSAGKRAAVLSSKTKYNDPRKDSPEVVPPSEEEEDGDYAFNSAPVKVAEVSSVQYSPDSISASSPALSLPSFQNSVAEPPKTKPGPGRSSAGIITKSKSSLLTFTKGGLQSVKGKYVPEKRDERVHDTDVEMAAVEPAEPNPPLPPPTGEELLNLAGLDAEAAKKLDDYEDEPESNSPTAAQSSLALAKEKLLPTGSVTSNNANAPWKSTISNTIFGPLGLASDVPPAPVTSDLIPVVLTDIVSILSSSSSWVFIAENKGLPGKFYDEKTALQIFNTLRTGSSAARVIPASNITEEQKAWFERFYTRLDDGALFILPVGKEVLALCSSENALFCQRLNIPSALSCLKKSVLLTRVTVENISAYADVAVPVDAFQWR
ncbi:hypothetical protein F5146DRAFT_1013477 [Armillaria mellea]|nr:hypothetical protein F5146DRAFT_1013477 [Armillaria mellea]